MTRIEMQHEMTRIIARYANMPSTAASFAMSYEIARLMQVDKQHNREWIHKSFKDGQSCEKQS